MRSIIFCLIFILAFESAANAKGTLSAAKSNKKKIVEVKFETTQIEAKKNRRSKVTVQRRVTQYKPTISEVELEPLYVKKVRSPKKDLFVGPPEPPASMLEPFQYREVASESGL